MKITFFSIANITYGGGYEEQISKMAAALAKKKHKVLVVNLSVKNTTRLAFVLSLLYMKPRFSFPEFQKGRIKSLLSHGVKIVDFSSAKELIEFLNKADVVYVKNELLDLAILTLIGGKISRPLIGGVHTLFGYALANNFSTKLHNKIYASGFYYSLLKRCWAFHCINPEQAKILKRQFPEKKVFYIPNFISVENRYKKLFIDDQLLILFVGRLTFEKGFDLFLKTVKYLSQSTGFSKMLFQICGSGPLRQSAEKLDKKFKNVSYKGFVSKARLKRLYRRADVLFLPSRGESLPVVCLEALSFGLLVLGSDISGIRSIVKNEQNGYLVKPGYVKDYAKTIEMIASYKFTNRRDYEKISERAVAYTRLNYSSKIIIPKLEVMFKATKNS